MSLTIGVACATLVVMGGILAGPAILDCSRSGEGLGACLRHRLEGGLLQQAPPAPTETVVSSEITPPLPVPRPIVADTRRTPGWLEANATEFAPEAGASAELSPQPGIIAAAGGNTVAPEPVPDVALAAPPGTLSAGGSGEVSPTGPAAVLSPQAGLLSAEATIAPVPEPVEVALAPATAGTLDAAAPIDAAPPVAAVALTGPVGAISAEGAEPPLPPEPPVVLAPAAGQIVAEGEGVALPSVADAEPVPVPQASSSEPEPPSVEPVTTLEPVPVVAAPARVEAPAGPTIRYDRRYPNVIVLPAPNTGRDSSFSTLVLR